MLSMVSKWVAVLCCVALLGACGSKGSSEPVAPTPTPSPTPSPATARGMVVFGTSSVFASHMPLADETHGYQLIAEIKLLTQPGQFAPGFLSKGNPFGFHTIAPEPFALLDMKEAGFRFPAVLYEGNFEEDKHVELGPVTVEVVRLIYFQKLEPAAEIPDVYQGVLFGNSNVGEYYLAHRMTGTASFDQISLIGEGGPGPNPDWGAGRDVVAFGHRDEPLARYAQIQLRVLGKLTALSTRAVYTQNLQK